MRMPYSVLTIGHPDPRENARGGQSDLFAGAAPEPESEPHPALDLLASIHPDELSPKEALELLYKLKAL